MVYNYSSTARAAELSEAVTGSATLLKVSSVAGLPSPPFTIVVDVATESEEIVTVTNVAGLNLTVQRGRDGTGAVPHQVGAVVRHMLTAESLRRWEAHLDAEAGVHGLAPGAAVVGTTTAQTLTGKTISGDVNTFQLVPGSALNDGSVTASKLGTGAVQTAKISDSAVTDAKIDSVAAAKLTGTVDKDRLPTTFNGGARFAGPGDQTLGVSSTDTAGGGQFRALTNGGASTLGALDFKGDGTQSHWSVGGLAGATGTAAAYLEKDGRLRVRTADGAFRPVPYAAAAGSAAVSGSGVTSVTFPTDRFNVAPIVTASGVGAGNVVGTVIITDVTPSGCGVRFFTHAGAQIAGTVTWQAMQMAPAAAAG